MNHFVEKLENIIRDWPTINGPEALRGLVIEMKQAHCPADIIPCVRGIISDGAINLIKGEPGTRITYVDTALCIRVIQLDMHIKEGVACWMPNFWVQVPDVKMERFLIEALQREAPDAEVIRVLRNERNSSEAFLWAVTSMCDKYA